MFRGHVARILRLYMLKYVLSNIRDLRGLKHTHQIHGESILTDLVTSGVLGFFHVCWVSEWIYINASVKRYTETT